MNLPIIVTQLGWGTTDGANLAVPSTGFEWLHYTNEDEQALYVTQAYQNRAETGKCLGDVFVQSQRLRGWR